MMKRYRWVLWFTLVASGSRGLLELVQTQYGSALIALAFAFTMVCLLGVSYSSNVQYRPPPRIVIVFFFIAAFVSAIGTIYELFALWK